MNEIKKSINTVFNKDISNLISKYLSHPLSDIIHKIRYIKKFPSKRKPENLIQLYPRHIMFHLATKGITYIGGIYYVDGKHITTDYMSISIF